jgi:hypothetical protein
MPYHRIRLELARDKQHPEGSRRQGYEILAPLDADGRIDGAAVAEQPGRASVERFWDGELTKLGQLIQTEGHWHIDYDPADEDDDVPFRMSAHRFEVGEYISIHEPDHGLKTFRVVSVVEEPDPSP